MLGDKVGYGRADFIIEIHKLGARTVRQQDLIPELSQYVYFLGCIGTISCGSDKALPKTFELGRDGVVVVYGDGGCGGVDIGDGIRISSPPVEAVKSFWH